MPESRDGLPGQRSARCISNRAGNHDRQFIADLFKILFNCKNCGFGIQRVENSFNQYDIRATINQPACGVGVSFDQFVKAYIAKARIIDIGRH